MASPGKNFGVGRALLLIALVFVTILSLGAIIYFIEITVISLWIPLIIAMAAAAEITAFSWRHWQFLTGNGSGIVNWLSSLTFFTILLTALLYIANYSGASSPTLQSAEITHKYRQQRHRQQRVGRNRYTQGAPYYVYFIDVTLPDGRQKTLQLPSSAFRRMPKAGAVNISISRGLLGADVINTATIISDNPQLEAPVKRKNRCRFFGTHGD
ncbi:MAG: hypothetical protein K2K29_00265 [Muribaculaceae bacterium]|nr:hypothetical protein [Muribaculaceae bacterium]